jgi:SAM-dependent methyltransferase
VEPPQTLRENPPREPADATPGTITGVARQYGDVAAIYDALMATVPHQAWLNRIEEIVRDRGKRPRAALDVACGTGLSTQLLVDHGYLPVVGVDLSLAMVSVARTKALARDLRPPLVRFECQDAAHLDLPGERFDLIISLFDSLNYILDPTDLRSAFHRVFAHTNPGGLFAFDLNALYALATDLFSQSGADGPIRHHWKAHWDPTARLCRVEMDFWVRDSGEEDEQDNRSVRHFHETHLQRAYTTTEITEWLTEAGWTNIAAFGNYGKRPPGPRSDRLLFVAERPA